MRNSMGEYPAMDLALTAVLVASKAEETYKKIQGILEAAMQILSPEIPSEDIDVLPTLTNHLPLPPMTRECILVCRLQRSIDSASSGTSLPSSKPSTLTLTLCMRTRQP